MKAALLAITMICLGLAGIAARADEAPAEAAKPDAAKFEVFPANIDLRTAADSQSIVARITQPDGITRDVTDKIRVTFSDPKLAAIDGHIVKPLADGSGEV